MSPIKLGKFIAKLRIEKGLTQDELADKINVNSGKTISKWECGTTFPDFDILAEIAKVLDVSLFELSICKRVKNKVIRELINSHIKSIKDYWKYSLIYRIFCIFMVFLGIFFGLCVVYTIDNYNKYHIYTFRSLDDNYSIIGNITTAKDYNIFNVIDLELLSNDMESYNKTVYDVEYEILYNDKRVVYSLSKREEEVKSRNLNDVINNMSFSNIITGNHFYNNQLLVFKISFRDKDNKLQFIEFKFKILEKIGSGFSNI